MMVKDQVKKAQEQLGEMPSAQEVLHALESLVDKLGDSAETIQRELAERFDDVQDDFEDRFGDRFGDLGERLWATNTKVAHTVTHRLATMPGAERMPNPATLIEQYFDSIERFTASNRELATKLLRPWTVDDTPADSPSPEPTETTEPAKPTGPAEPAATTAPSAAPKPAAKRPARKTTAAKSATPKRGTAKSATAKAGGQTAAKPAGGTTED